MFQHRIKELFRFKSIKTVKAGGTPLMLTTFQLMIHLEEKRARD
jgi:hypothetical protein